MRITETEKDGKLEGMTLDSIAREEARRTPSGTPGAEVAGHVERHGDDRDEAGRALVARNGKTLKRRVTVGSAAIEVEAP